MKGQFQAPQHCNGASEDFFEMNLLFRHILLDIFFLIMRPTVSEIENGGDLSPPPPPWLVSQKNTVADRVKNFARKLFTEISEHHS